MKFTPSLLLILALVTSTSLVAAELYTPKYEDNEIMLRIVERTPENISAFYQGREFEKKAIDEILNTCYFTVIVKNKTQTTLWLELDNWQFSRGQKLISRIKRDYWKKRWDTINLIQAHRSTFGWTLMPESRDLRADEGVGGSIVIPKQTEPFTVVANFHTKPDKSGPIKTVTIQGAKCVEDIEPIK
ncbi:MAG: hypothetical protein OEM38_08850 [Gammaproteobacteria bacterium]|nr:hypothetical protein [Gammaproteobacteria bacterium]